jgi:peptide/nickel transport system permease protein
MSAGLTSFRPWRRLPAILGCLILALTVLAAIFASALYPEGPWPRVGDPYSPPFASLATPLGTDGLGRDVVVGLLYGARVSLTVGLVATFGAVLFGVIVGAVAGYVRGWVDDCLMRFTEIFQTIPTFIFVIVLIVILQPSLATMIGAIAIASWPPVARLVRGEFLTLGGREFVASCRLIGLSPVRIIFMEILPNCLPPIIVIGSVMVATAVLTEAGLAFLGLGDPNVMSWGAMVAGGRPVIRSAAYLSILPGLCILSVVMAINFVSEAFNDSMNPRLRAE